MMHKLLLADDSVTIQRVIELTFSGEDIQVVVGGIIPDADVPKLNALGITGVFQPGTPMQEIVEFIRGRAGAGTAAKVE